MNKKELEEKLAEYVVDNQKQFDIIKQKNNYITILENRITDLELQIDRLNFEIKVKDDLMKAENELRKEKNGNKGIQ
jgi:hypothetical protein